MAAGGLLVHYLRLALERSGVRIDGDVTAELGELEQWARDVDNRLAALEGFIEACEPVPAPKPPKPAKRRRGRKRAPVKPRPYIGPCYDPLRLWFLEFERGGEVLRTYHGDRAEAREALRKMKGRK